MGNRGDKSPCSIHGSPSGWLNESALSGLPRTEAGLQSAETRAKNHRMVAEQFMQ